MCPSFCPIDIIFFSSTLGLFFILLLKNVYPGIVRGEKNVNNDYVKNKSCVTFVTQCVTNVLGLKYEGNLTVLLALQKHILY